MTSFTFSKIILISPLLWSIKMMSQNIIISSGRTQFMKIWIEDKLKCNLSTKRWLCGHFLASFYLNKGVEKEQ